MSFIFNLIKQDFKLATKKGSGIGNTLAFYIMTSSLFVFGVGSQQVNISHIALAVIWVCALLVQSISISRIFADDYEDGTLKQLFLQGELIEKIVIARMVSNWLTGSFLIILLSPLIAILFGMSWNVIIMLLISLLCGTPLLSVLSVAAAAVIIGVRKSGVIFGILIFPLFVPVLIFGTSWGASPELFINNMGLLIALLLFMFPLCVLAAVAAIKTAFEEG